MPTTKKKANFSRLVRVGVCVHNFHSTMSYPQCILCRAFCRADMNYCLPQCAGREKGYAHFFCRNCWDQTIARVRFHCIQCTGCQLGMPGAPIAPPAAHLAAHLAAAEPGDDCEMSDV